jgi:hypothetical protein
VYVLGHLVDGHDIVHGADGDGPGMPHTTRVASPCAIVRLPAARISLQARSAILTYSGEQNPDGVLTRAGR